MVAIKALVLGLQHIGIPTNSIKETIDFFTSIESMRRKLKENKWYSSTVGMENENLIILGKVVGWVHNHPY